MGNGDDVEATAGVEKKKYQMDVRTWPLLCLLYIASVVGSVGCFSIVQNSASTSGPFSSLLLETGVWVMRLATWARSIQYIVRTMTSPTFLSIEANSLHQ